MLTDPKPPSSIEGTIPWGGTLGGWSVGALIRSELDTFALQVRTEVSVHYPGTERSYPYKLAAEHFSSHCSLLHSGTRSRCIWVLRDASRKPIAFFVASHKGSHAVKLGPVVVAKAWRRLGVGTTFLRFLVHHYTVLGKQRMYFTAPQPLESLTALAQASGFQSEGRLRRQYSSSWDENVFGRHLSWNSGHSSFRLEDVEKTEVAYIASLLPGWQPARSFHRSQTRPVTLVPKRGGATKVECSPSDFTDAVPRGRALEAVVRSTDVRKAYVIIGDENRALIDTFRTLGFATEATFRRTPYSLDSYVLGLLRSKP